MWPVTRRACRSTSASRDSRSHVTSATGAESSRARIANGQLRRRRRTRGGSRSQYAASGRPGSRYRDFHEPPGARSGTGLDRTAIGYIGDYDSGASAVSIPLLNKAGIPQISPASTAVGLTRGGPEASPGEPQKYYPTGVRTFARVIPNDSVQAAAQAKLQRAMGCRKTMILDDGEVDGRDEAESFQVAAKAAGLDVLGDQEFLPRATDYTSLAQGLVPTGADCIFVSAITDSNAALLVRQVAAAMPHALIFGSAGLGETTFTNPRQGGIPLVDDPRVLITVATLDPRAYPPAGRRFFAVYARHYGTIEPSAIYGYAAMSLMLDAIARATDGGRKPAVRSRVLAAIFATHNRPSVLGPYTIDRNGDTSINVYGGLPGAGRPAQLLEGDHGMRERFGFC